MSEERETFDCCKHCGGDATREGNPNDHRCNVEVPELLQVGLLLDGKEFIPQDIADRYYPFAVLPGETCEAVYVLKVSGTVADRGA